MRKTIQLMAIIIVMICSHVKLNAQLVCYVNAGSDQTFCCGPAVVTLSAIATASNCNCSNYSYVWTPTVGLSNPYIANPTATINSTTTYTVCMTAYRKNLCSILCCSACDAITINVNSSCCRTTGLSTLDNKPLDIKVYPNPSTSLLTVDIGSELNKAIINIYDVTGRVMWQKSNVAGKNKFEINVSDMPRGVYFITAQENGKEVYNNKIILE